jgi:WS/DGAT/MGAT family acyltransferase
MRQLTSLDAQFLAVEDGRTVGHVSALAILDPSTAPGGKLTLESVQATVSERIHLLPPFRWRLRRVPFGLAHPYWVDDARFDVDFHVRELALPAPGSRKQLADQVARISGRPLDRGRPLWELYLIQGLADGQVAMLTKMHHAAVDGMSGSELLSVLLDASPEGREVPEAVPAAPERLPRDLELLARGAASVSLQPLRALRAAPRTLANLDAHPTMRNLPGARLVSRVASRVTHPVGRDGGTLEHPRMQAPRTPFNGPITPHRRVSLVTLPLSDVKRIKDVNGTTVNDVVVALCTGALRRWLSDHDVLPDESLLAMIPVSVRTAEERGTFGNRVSMMVVPLPTEQPDAGDRLKACHEALRSAKDRHHAMPASLLQDANEFIPPALFARAARVMISASTYDAMSPAVNVVISNVPGSPTPMYFAGATLVAQYPVSTILDGIGLNITVLSYQDRLDFGLVADRVQVPDLDTISEALEAELAELLSRLPRPPGRSKATTSPSATVDRTAHQEPVRSTR